ncbi:OsmC family peroxiredoxin [Chitinophaga pinensis]|uniref:OsmC family protein n=1 Tax=Chitinophaga pinensis (strain ATCC 43595 / DSM 2588 / LMG 13176 / NBRC 15968 / NCIMB 11800 / UQM 2034) TaxID=485918 RepID=A0A979GNX2_CHIPD|nr:OsmC family peroxiredoxin [Chitinophaga pinensis]ACU58848.1 OsmC family protein [Chitinophaga pinensis DSM 2588]
MKRYAKAIWHGAGKDGRGHMTTESEALDKQVYSFSSRFTSEEGTNPEELLAAAHAGCFTMKLSFVLDEAGYFPEALETTAYVNFENGVITASRLVVTGKVWGISPDDFDVCVREAKRNCPVSMALNIMITTEANLQNW